MPCILYKRVRRVNSILWSIHSTLITVTSRTNLLITFLLCFEQASSVMHPFHFNRIVHPKIEFRHLLTLMLFQNCIMWNTKDNLEPHWLSLYGKKKPALKYLLLCCCEWLSFHFWVNLSFNSTAEVLGL